MENGSDQWPTVIVLLLLCSCNPSVHPLEVVLVFFCTSYSFFSVFIFLPVFIFLFFISFFLSSGRGGRAWPIVEINKSYWRNVSSHVIPLTWSTHILTHSEYNRDTAMFDPTVFYSLLMNQQTISQLEILRSVLSVHVLAICYVLYWHYDLCLLSSGVSSSDTCPLVFGSSKYGEKWISKYW